MKNILITANYKITGKQFGGWKPAYFSKISKLCVESFKKNLKDIDEIIVLEGEEDDYNDMFKDIFYKTKEIWLREPCNILWTDTDTLCLKPTEIFGRYDDFRMFFAMVPERKYGPIVPHELYKELNPWMMSNLRYFPHSINKHVWEEGELLVENWIDIWAYECIVYNTMFYSQNPEDVFKNYHMPDLNFQYVLMKQDIELNNRNIIHFGSSRGSRAVLDIMNQHLKRILE